VKYLVVVRRFVQEAVMVYGGTQRAADDLIQAADELSANIILHGYQGQPGEIEIIVRPEGEGVAVILRDRAPHFDPASIREPDLNTPLEERQIGGLGIFLSRKLTDEMRYQALPEGGNELTLVKHSLGTAAQTK
jgi:serine/threonine-protein kinase RsbW